MEIQGWGSRDNLFSLIFASSLRMIFKRRGACLAQSVKQLILGFGSGHDLMGPKTEPPVEPGQQSA